MKVVLTGPDDQGFFYLTDYHLRDYRIVEKWEHYAGAAMLFGWVPCPCGKTNGTFDCDHRTVDEMAEEARDFLMEHVGEEIEAPLHIQSFFDEWDE